MEESNTKIVIYGTVSCHYCKIAKEYFVSKEIEFRYVDLYSNKEESQEIINKTGFSSVPIIQIGNKYLCGFNKAKIEELL